MQRSLHAFHLAALMALVRLSKVACGAFYPLAKGVTFAGLLCSAANAQTSATETRLRDALRNAQSQVRLLESERVAYQTKEAENEKEIAALRAQVESLTKRIGRESGSAERESLAAYKSRVMAQEEAIIELKANVEKLKTSQTQASEAARATQAERAQLASERDSLAQRATACEAKNAELFKVGNEILTRYANVDFGDVMRTREPFIGTKRVQLQNIVQDYQDKLLNSKALP